MAWRLAGADLVAVNLTDLLSARRGHFLLESGEPLEDPAQRR